MRTTVFTIALVAACDFPRLPDVMPPPDSPKDISSFRFLVTDNPGLTHDVTATITDTTIAATLPFEANATELKADFTTTGASVTVNGTPQTSEVTANDFTHGLVYTVTAADGTTKEYTAKVRIPTFAPKIDVATGANPASIAIGDFNGDGLVDLAIANAGASSVSILVNTTPTGATTPTFATTDIGTGTASAGLAIADVNGDGKPDLLVADTNANAVSVLLDTTGTGEVMASFAPIASFTTQLPQAVAVADLNGDGLLDLAVAPAGNNNTRPPVFSVLVNAAPRDTTMPMFTRFDAGCCAFVPELIATADFNGDGKPDLAVNEQNSLTIQLNQTTTPTMLLFGNAFTLPGNGTANSLALGDINGDGKPDVAFTTANVSPATMSIALNNTVTGSSIPMFATHVDFAVGVGPDAVAIADLDGDGNPDVIVANGASNTISIFPNTTATNAMMPTFAPKLDFPTGMSPIAIAVADVNGDGLPDIVVVNGAGGGVSIFVAQ